MKILHYIGDRTGVFLYRAYFPSMALQDNTEHNILFSKNNSTVNVDSLAEMAWCDIAVFHRQWLDNTLEAMKYLRKIGKKIVFEIDDDWTHLNPDNPFNETLKKQPKILEGIKKACKYADYITVTNERLAKIMKRYNKNIKILPNYISSYFFDFNVTKQEKDSKHINLYWSGAQNHLENMKLLVEPIKILMSKYNNLKFWIVGHNYSYLFPFLQKKQIVHIPWMHLEAYPSAFTYADIALAPMSDNLFNASKSNIRVLEYSYFKLPIVASNIYTYAETLEHGKNGFLANNTDDWVKYLSMLIDDKKLRKQIGNKARKNAINNCIENNYGKYEEFYKDLLKVA